MSDHPGDSGTPGAGDPPRTMIATPSPAGRGALAFAAVAGGLIGSLLTVTLVLVGGPKLGSGRMVHDALVAHPEMLVEASEALKSRQYAPTITANRAALETPYFSAWKGAARPDVTLVYFFDYACGYCRMSNPAIDRLLAEDKGVRVVFRELPILGANSVAAARISLIAARTGKFAAYHDALFAGGQPTPEAIGAALQSVGLPQPPANFDTREVDSEIRKNMAIAQALGATGTPLFVIGDQAINAAMGYDALKQAVATARKTAS